MHYKIVPKPDQRFDNLELALVSLVVTSRTTFENHNKSESQLGEYPLTCKNPSDYKPQSQRPEYTLTCKNPSAIESLIYYFRQKNGYLFPKVAEHQPTQKSAKNGGTEVSSSGATMSATEAYNKVVKMIGKKLGKNTNLTQRLGKLFDTADHNLDKMVFQANWTCFGCNRVYERTRESWSLVVNPNNNVLDLNAVLKQKKYEEVLKCGVCSKGGWFDDWQLTNSPKFIAVEISTENFRTKQNTCIEIPLVLDWTFTAKLDTQLDTQYGLDGIIFERNGANVMIVERDGNFWEFFDGKVTLVDLSLLWERFRHSKRTLVIYQTEPINDSLTRASPKYAMPIIISRPGQGPNKVFRRNSVLEKIFVD